MTAKEAVRPEASRVSVAECVNEVRVLTKRKDMAGRAYADSRRRGRPAEIARARLQWGVGLLEWASAMVVAEAAADGDYEACHGYALPPLSPAVAGQGACPDTACQDAKQRFSACQREYRRVRAGVDKVATKAARDAMAQALHDFIWAELACKAAEDDQDVDRRREARDSALRFSPGDSTTRPQDPAQEVARRGRERERRENIEHERARYGPTANS